MTDIRVTFDRELAIRDGHPPRTNVIVLQGVRVLIVPQLAPRERREYQNG